MKIKGDRLDGPQPLECIIPRTEGKHIRFVCGPVLDYSEFNELVPEPKVKYFTDVKTKEKTALYDDPAYKKAWLDRGEMKAAWFAITSLSFTPDIEWEQVKMGDPKTFSLYEKELREFLTEGEMQQLIGTIYDANHPSEARKKEALASFAASQVAAMVPAPSSPTDEQDSTPAGGLASD